MRKLLILFVLSLFISGCGWLNSSIMLKTDRNFKYDVNTDTTANFDYKLSPNDILDVRMYANDGFKLIDLTSLNDANNGYKLNDRINYSIESDGTVKLPIIGKRKVAGLTIKEVQSNLEELYSSFYIKPFVLVSIINRRVIVFTGKSGGAQVIPILNNNTTLIEAIALAGGLDEEGKAKKIKLIRAKNGKQEVYLMDLSTINGINDAKRVLQANDIIYVEPRRKYSSRALQEIAPIVSLITSTIILVSYTKLLSK